MQKLPALKQVPDIRLSAIRPAIAHPASGKLPPVAAAPVASRKKDTGGVVVNSQFVLYRMMGVNSHAGDGPSGGGA
jgi:hypothetical protein